MRRSLSLATSIFAVLSTLHAVPQTAPQTALSNTPGKVGASAVWQPPQDFVTKAHDVCDKGAGPAGSGVCFINQMSVAGAPADAVAFTRMLSAKTDGQVGIMVAFKNFGPVDAAQVLYPLRANDNYGLLLVNGDPAVLDVDDLKKLDRAAMEANPMYVAVKQKFPESDVWPGDRSGTEIWPKVQPLPAGGTEFVVSYPLINGCHACRHTGVARFGWDFDANGKFLHTTFIPTPPPPRLLHHPPQGPRVPPPPSADQPPPAPSAPPAQ